MGNMKKNILVKLLLCLFVLVLNSSVFASNGKWERENDFWKYYENSDYIRSRWKNIDAIDYYFDEYGHMATGIVQIGQKFYAFQEDGKPFPINSFINMLGKTFNIGEKGYIKNLPRDFVLSDIDYYNESIQRENEEKEMSKAAYEANLAKLETREKNPNETFSNVGPLGVIAPMEKSSDYVSPVDEYQINHDDVNKLLQIIDNAINYNTAKKNLITEFNAQLNLLRIDVNNGYTNVDYEVITEKYKLLVEDLVDYFSIRFEVGNGVIKNLRSELLQIINKAVNKYERED